MNKTRDCENSQSLFHYAFLSFIINIESITTHATNATSETYGITLKRNPKKAPADTLIINKGVTRQIQGKMIKSLHFTFLFKNPTIPIITANIGDHADINMNASPEKIPPMVASHIIGFAILSPIIDDKLEPKFEIYTIVAIEYHKVKAIDKPEKTSNFLFIKSPLNYILQGFILHCYHLLSISIIA